MGRAIPGDAKELAQPQDIAVREEGGWSGDVDYHHAADRTAQIEKIAQVVYEANRAYAATLGDFSFGAWQHAPDWQKATIINGVTLYLAGESLTPEQSHASWLQEKIETGWVYGPEKNAVLKEHPCMVPYAELPAAQRRKDHLFLAICAALLDPIS